MNKTNSTSITLITEEQIPAAGEMLAEAFFDDPLCIYTSPDPEERRTLFPWLFVQYLQGMVPFGNVYTTPGQPYGCALWLPPQTGEETAEQEAHNEQDQAEPPVAPEAYHRFTRTYSYFEQIHHRLMTEPHWYLAVLGVSPHLQGQGLGSALIAPIFQRADQEGLPCYLETFNPKNVPYYEHRGFQVIEAGAEPQSQVRYWSMKREPQPLR